MADVVTLGDVSSSDKGSGTKLKTGGRRQHNMPKKCVEMKIKGGMSRAAAVKACYPERKAVDTKKRTIMGKPLKERKGVMVSKSTKQQAQGLMKKIKSKKGY